MITEQDIINRTRKIVLEYGVDTPEVNITGETRFLEDLNFDSLDSVEFVMDLEDEFGIEIEDLYMEQTKTFGEAVAVVKKLLGVQ